MSLIGIVEVGYMCIGNFQRRWNYVIPIKHDITSIKVFPHRSLHIILFLSDTARFRLQTIFPLGISRMGHNLLRHHRAPSYLLERPLELESGTSQLRSLQIYATQQDKQ